MLSVRPTDFGHGLYDECSETALLSVCHYLTLSQGRFRERLLPILLRTVLLLPWWRRDEAGGTASSKIEGFAQQYEFVIVFIQLIELQIGRHTFLSGPICSGLRVDC